MLSWLRCWQKKFLHCSDFLISGPLRCEGAFFCGLYYADKWAILFADFYT